MGQRADSVFVAVAAWRSNRGTRLHILEALRRDVFDKAIRKRGIRAWRALCEVK